MIRPSNAGGVEGIGLDQVCVSFQETPVDLLDRAWPAEAEQIIVAAQGKGVVCKAGTAESVFIKLQVLDHGAHGAIDQQDTSLQQRLQRGNSVRVTPV